MSPWWQLLGLLSWCAIFNQVTSLHSRKTDPQIPLTSAQYSTWTWLHDSSTTRTALVIEANRYIIISFKHVDMGADNQHGKFGQMQNIDYLANPRESIPNTYLYYSHDCDDTLTGHPSLPPHHPSPPHTTHTHTHPTPPPRQQHYENSAAISFVSEILLGRITKNRSALNLR